MLKLGNSSLLGPVRLDNPLKAHIKPHSFFGQLSAVDQVKGHLLSFL